MPNKTKYIQNGEGLNLTGGVIKVTYNDGATEEVFMTSEQVEATGFNNTVIGKCKITLTYQSKQTEFEIEIQMEIQPISFDYFNMVCDVKTIKNMAIVNLITIITITGTVLYIKYRKLNKDMK